MSNSHRLSLKLRARCGIVGILSGFKPIFRSFFLFLRLLCKNLIVYFCPGISCLKWSDIGYPDRFQAYRGIFILGDTKSVRRLCYA